MSDDTTQQRAWRIEPSQDNKAHSIALGYLEPSKSQEESMTGGKWMTQPLPEEFHPVRIYVRRGNWHGRDFALGPMIGDLLVSSKLRALWLEFEPEAVHFEPVELTLKDGTVVTDGFWIPKVTQKLDALIPEKSAVSPEIYFLTGEPTGRWMYLKSVPPTQKLDIVSDHHIWELPNLVNGGIFVSDALKTAMEARKLKPFRAEPSPLE